MDLIEPKSQSEQEATHLVAMLVDGAYEKLFKQTSPSMRRYLRKVIIRTSWDSKSRDKYGEYYGVPAPKQTPYDSGMVPSDIVLFARPILEDYPAPEDLERKVHLVLVHEIGHYLGLSEAELRRRKIY